MRVRVKDSVVRHIYNSTSHQVRLLHLHLGPVSGHLVLQRGHEGDVPVSVERRGGRGDQRGRVVYSVRGGARVRACSSKRMHWGVGQRHRSMVVLLLRWLLLLLL